MHLGGDHDNHNYDPPPIERVVVINKMTALYPTQFEIAEERVC